MALITCDWMHLIMACSIDILISGKKQSLLSPPTKRYLELVRPYAQVNMRIVKPLRLLNMSAETRLDRESEHLLQQAPPGCRLIGLTERGQTFDSPQFAQWLVDNVQNKARLGLLIGGAFGLSPSVLNRCDEKVSLSPLTFPHHIALMILVEQLYRAFTIIRHHPYHK
ncbi:MAG: 23S rRNA (pseudouridine(1915)-N(3))-methyltransferase RlmH [Chitinivibrionales bacterium]|nr:23S rRNA (pseudouridine(1915)-N(3))-methyltransferase RlmH [Chitinivibrionales bacterium]